MFQVRQALGYNGHITANPDEACVFVALVGEMTISGTPLDHQLLESNLHSLPYWNGDGRNHVLLNLAHTLYAVEWVYISANNFSANKLPNFPPINYPIFRQ